MAVVLLVAPALDISFGTGRTPQTGSSRLCFAFVAMQGASTTPVLTALSWGGVAAHIISGCVQVTAANCAIQGAYWLETDIASIAASSTFSATATNGPNNYLSVFECGNCQQVAASTYASFGQTGNGNSGTSLNLTAAVGDAIIGCGTSAGASSTNLTWSGSGFSSSSATHASGGDVTGLSAGSYSLQAVWAGGGFNWASLSVDIPAPPTVSILMGQACLASPYPYGRHKR